MADPLAQYDPEELRNVIVDLRSRLEALEQGFVSANRADELVQEIGEAGSAIFAQGEGVIDESGMQLTSDLMDVKFWASIGVPSNVVGFVYAIAFSGPIMYVGGFFTKIGGIDANNIATYNIVTGVWSQLGSGLNDIVREIVISGTDVYIGGTFTNAGGVAAADYITRWDGAVYNAVGGGLNQEVYALALDGTDLYIGGIFQDAGGVAGADFITRWDGAAYNALGSGLNNSVHAIAINGTDVYIGGSFTDAGGVAAADRITRWDGAAYNALGSGLNNIVRAITINGFDVYIGGSFTNAGGVAEADYLTRWDGSAYNALGSGLNNVVRAITISATDVYIGGDFTDAGGVAEADYLTLWNGAAYYALGSGMNGVVHVITINGTDLYVGGTFTTAGGRASKNIAAYLRSLESVLTYLEVAGQALQDNMLTDVTAYNATTGRHGLMPKLSGVGTQYLNGLGTFTTPSGGGGELNINLNAPTTNQTINSGYSVYVAKKYEVLPGVTTEIGATGILEIG